MSSLEDLKEEEKRLQEKVYQLGGRRSKKAKKALLRLAEVQGKIAGFKK